MLQQRPLERSKLISLVKYYALDATTGSMASDIRSQWSNNHHTKVEEVYWWGTSACNVTKDQTLWRKVFFPFNILRFWYSFFPPFHFQSFLSLTEIIRFLLRYVLLSHKLYKYILYCIKRTGYRKDAVQRDKRTLPQLPFAEGSCEKSRGEEGDRHRGRQDGISYSTFIL